MARHLGSSWGVIHDQDKDDRDRYDHDRHDKAKHRDKLKHATDEKAALLQLLEELTYVESALEPNVIGKNVDEDIRARRAEQPSKAKGLPKVNADLYENVKDHRGRGAASAASTGPHESDNPKVPTILKDGVVYDMSHTQRASSSERDKELRTQMYDAQVQAGKFEPGPRARYEQSKRNDQVKCKHPFETLKWGGNRFAVYASCAKCGLRSVILYTKKRMDNYETEGVPNTNGRKNGNQTFMTNETYQVHLQPGTAMADTGCRRAVGGETWHREFQAALDDRGESCRSVACNEVFLFGPGKSIRATRRWIYPVGVHGNRGELRIAEVPAVVPGLIGPDELSNWETEIHVTDGTIGIHGVRAPLRSSEFGHPCINLLDFSGPENEVEVPETEVEEMPKPADPDWCYVDENDIHYADDAVSHVSDSSSEGEPVPHFPEGFDDEEKYDIYQRELESYRAMFQDSDHSDSTDESSH